jgi:hypothetical protein
MISVCMYQDSGANLALQSNRTICLQFDCLSMNYILYAVFWHPSKCEPEPQMVAKTFMVDWCLNSQVKLETITL